MKYVKVIVFSKGKRTERNVAWDQRDKAVAAVKALRAKGLKANIALPTTSEHFKGYWPPRSEVRDKRDEGYLWCPYCRAWRYFRVPMHHPNAVIGSDQWFLNSYHNQETRVCSWCTVGELDFHVGYVNGTFNEARAGKRRRNTNRRRRRVRP